MPQKSRQQLFVDLFLPSILTFCSMRFIGLDADARAEATQDIVTSAWQTVSSASEDRLWHGEADRRGRITPQTITNYAVGNYKGGRRIAGHSSSDAIGPTAVATGTRVVGITTHGFDADSVAVGTIEIPAVLLTRASAAPAAQARANIDWGIIAQRCTPRGQEVLGMLAQGFTGVEIATRLGMSPARVCQLKDKIAAVVRSLGYEPAGLRAQVA